MSYSYAHLRIDCTLAEAKSIQSALDLLRDQMESWDVAPDSAADLPSEAKDWPEWVKEFCVELAKDSFEHQRDFLSFESYLSLPTVQGRPVETEEHFRGLVLEGEMTEDDIFVAAHLALKVLASEQLISTGTAYTADRPDEHTYSGNHVVITRHGWQFLFDYDDVTASEAEAAYNIGYWLLTFGREAVIWVAEAGDDEAAVIEEARSVVGQLRFDASTTADLVATQIPATTFRHLKGALSVFESGSVSS